MNLKHFLTVIVVFLFINGAEAQLGGLLKKKKDKEENAVADTTTKPAAEEKEEKKKGGGLFQKVIGKISKTAGNAVMGAGGGVTSIDNLEEADIIVSTGTNIYSKDLGLMITDFLGKEWINNGDFTMLQLASRDAFRMYTYPGAIKVNGKELKHASMGIHTVTEPAGSGNKKISFEKNGTVEGTFEIPLPEKNVKLLSVNGQPKNAKVDFTRDVTMELAGFSTAPDALIRVDVVGTIIGIRTLYLVCYVKPAAKITIPAAAFSHLETTNKGLKFKDCYLSISDQQLVKAINPTGKVPSTQMVITGSNDGMWVDVSNNRDLNTGLKLTTGSAVTEKGNAAYAKPLSFAKTTAVSSFYTYGTTYLYDESKNGWTQSTTTKTIDFPEIPEAYLDGMLQDLYTKLTASYTEVTGHTVLPAATIPGLPAYENTRKFFPGEINNDGEFLKAYNGLEPVRTLTTVGNRYYGDGTLLKEANADALLKVSLICQLSWKDKPEMTPYLKVELVGGNNGDFRSFTGSTKYFTMNIRGDGYELKKKAPVDFAKVFQVDELNAQFKKALTELKAKEQTIPDYETIWNLQQ